MSKAAARLLVVAAAATLAGSASARSGSIGFTFVPGHVVQGDDARVSVSVRPTGSRCTLSVRYQDGTAQPGLGPATATGGRATWTWRVPSDVQAGPAKATVRCARVGASTRRLMIVGRLVEPKITVSKSGFSVKPNGAAGSILSYGLILHNGSPTKAALDVKVQINFVLADNNLLGTTTAQISGIAAGSDYALGGQTFFPGAAPVTRLEVVLQAGSFAVKALPQGTLANIHLVPQPFDPKWVGTVEGELQNTDPAMTLQSATLSAVVFDSAGNVIGGGNGFVFQALPPGAREFIQVSNGLNAIPSDRAASTMVSTTTTWQPPGS